jgi:hypothetical protein
VEFTLVSLHRLLADKEVISRNDFNETVKFEQDRAVQFQKVQQSVASYKERLEICKEWKIPAEATVIPSQIQDDITLSADDKIALTIEFNIAPELVTET